MLTLGAKAPAFTLPDQDGKQVSLQDLRGRWVVLYFYPKDDTPGCTVEACEFTAALPAFRGLDAVVYGCSADGASAHQKFIAKHKLGIGLLTDANKKVMQAYGAYGKKLMYGKEVEGVIRSTVLIAPDGVVAHHWPKVKAEGHAEAVRAALAALQGGAVAPTAAAKKPAKAPAPAKKVAAKPAAAKKPVAKAAAKPAAKAAAKKAK
jgi:peroxiredoxin Q/BCP